MFSCRLKTCPVSLLLRSFYDKLLAEGYILAGHGIGFSPLFVLAVLSALVYAVYSILFLSAFSPEIITEKVVDLPTIEVRDGKIVGHVEASAVVAGIAVSAANGAADYQIQIADQRFDADTHGRMFFHRRIRIGSSVGKGPKIFCAKLCPKGGNVCHFDK